ncbi:hypothetical protein PLICRDRAFT_41947 [Plicaturopsis crispa FD-325 SS-3]|nr:hypothetical protein PLICRDRAFT_41947 [Plicaturopsis crispa FD-325 SS-3]
MHGGKRVRQSKEAIDARRQREASKLKEYLALTDDVLARKKRRDWSRDAFEQTLQLLHINPEFYTVWNYRRNILLNGIFPESTAEKINTLLSNELSMTTAALKAHPKVYWIWNHRRWCLENVPDGPGGNDSEGDPHGWKKANWDRELFIVQKMLDADARNFLAWDYRRYVLASMPVPRSDASELAYTRRKIDANFSNFSAWHQRSKVFSSMWASGTLDPTKSREQEFELVTNAMYTDPNDQSVWMYHRWLIGTGEDLDILDREIGLIQDLLNEQPDSKWCMESLVYYKRLLSKHRPEKGDELTQECAGLLKELETLDPDRKRRYQEIAKSVQ